MDGKVFAVSDKGVVLGLVSGEMSQTVRTIVNETSIEPKDGVSFLTRSDILFIGELFHQMESSKETGEITLSAYPNEVHMKPSGKNYYVKFMLDNKTDSARLQYGAYRATQAQIDREGAKPTQYIDARVVERVFVL